MGKDAAISAYNACIAKNANLVAPYLPLALMLKDAGKNAEAKEVLDKAIALHPRAIFIRHKAYIMADAGMEKDALEYLDSQIAQPPHEEAEAVFSQMSSNVGEFHKAKAAILADGGKFEEAKASLQAALKLFAEDPEAKSMLGVIEDALNAPAASPEKSA